MATAASAQSNQPVQQAAPNVPEFSPAFPQQTRAPAAASDVGFTVNELAGPLEHPWGMDALPDGNYLVTERPGRLRVVRTDGTISDPVVGLPEVFSENQGGLLDIRVGPNFPEDRLIYWTYPKPIDG